MSRQRGCLIGAAILAGIIVIAGFLLARSLTSQVNVLGLVGSGGPAEQLTVPPGFEANVFAEGLSGPRFMALGPEGDLYVADRGNARIVALPDADGDGRADNIRVFAENLDGVHSLVYRDGSWYAAVPTGVIELIDTDGDGVADERRTLTDALPGAHHSTRTVLFLPDGRMVVSIGSSCNVCVEQDPRRAAIVVYDPLPPAGERVYASGLRNAVGLTLHPDSGELWATNNGRDLMGDDLPPETLYIIKDGGDYGWPACHSGRILDPNLGAPGDCDGVIAPVVEMQAHSAPLGLAFYTGDAFPPEYQGDLFIAFHGSWNRSLPTGYKMVRLPFEDGQPAGPVEDFAAGWLADDGAISGRPVGVTVGSDGALYISDDRGGLIYRISYPPSR